MLLQAIGMLTDATAKALAQMQHGTKHGHNQLGSNPCSEAILHPAFALKPSNALGGVLRQAARTAPRKLYGNFAYGWETSCTTALRKPSTCPVVLEFGASARKPQAVRNCEF